MYENKTFVNDNDYSNFSFLGFRNRNQITSEAIKQSNNGEYTSNSGLIKDLPKGIFGFKRKVKRTKKQKFSILRLHFNNNKFLQNYVRLLARKKELLEQLKVMRNQQQAQSVQNEIKSLEAQLKTMQNDNKISLQKKVEGAVPTEIIQAVMVSNIPTSGVINDDYIDEISNSVSDDSVDEIPTNIPNDNSGGGIGYSEPSGYMPPVEQTTPSEQQSDEVVDTKIGEVPVKKDNTMLYLAVGIVAVLLLTRR